MKKSYIWSLPTRVFHWLFALLILIAFLSDDDKYLKLHAVAGYSILILLAFRVAWGYFGPKYSLFKDFTLDKAKLIEFIKQIFSSEQKYIGHNPMASYVMIGILITVFLIILSGAFALGIQEGKGVFSFLHISFFKKMKLFKEIHEFFANILLFLISAHLLGVIFDRLFHSKYNTLNSIFNGYKMLDTEENIKLNIFQKLLAFIVFVCFMVFLFFALISPKNILTSSIYTPIDYKKENITFAKECGSCHTLYPPTLLPKKSWELLMASLEDHFGDDATIDMQKHQEILEFLTKNSAETSTMEASLYFSDSIGSKDIISLSKTDYWIQKHSKIPKEVFNSKLVKNASNCKACHSDIEKGLIEDENIKDISYIM